MATGIGYIISTLGSKSSGKSLTFGTLGWGLSKGVSNFSESGNFYLDRADNIDYSYFSVIGFSDF